MQIPLRYGCNPHQQSARVIMPGDSSPLRVVNGAPGYINILDALSAWQLVRELGEATGKVAAASFKHVSPAGAAVAGPVSDAFAASQLLRSPPQDPVAQAYVRARGADRMSSFGDAAAVSGTVTLELAEILKHEVSDLIIAPGYEPEALELLRSKKRGNYLILEMDPSYEPGPMERRELFGIGLEQERNAEPIRGRLFRSNGPAEVPEDVVETLVVATVALKYTQSNSVCVAYQGQVIGMAAGQQSRIHCTRLACSKAEKWMLQTHPEVLDLEFPEGAGRPVKTNSVDQYLLWNELSETERDALRATLGYEPTTLSAEERTDWFRTFQGLCLSSDAFIPFRDNVDRAASLGVEYIAHTGGSLRDSEVRGAAEEHGVVMIETGVRCFLH